MGFLSSLWKAIKSIVSKIIKWVVDFIREYIWVIIALVVVWYAPQISAYLVEAGAPSFMTTALATVSDVVTPLLKDAVGFVWKGVTTMASDGWTAFKAAEFGTKMSVLVGAGMLIAPEETSELLAETAELTTSLVGSVIGSVGSTILANPYVLIGVGALVYFWLRKKPGAAVGNSPVPSGRAVKQPTDGRQSYVAPLGVTPMEV